MYHIFSLKFMRSRIHIGLLTPKCIYRHIPSHFLAGIRTSSAHTHSHTHSLARTHKQTYHTHSHNHTNTRAHETLVKTCSALFLRESETK